MKAFLQQYTPQWQPHRPILRALPPVLSGLVWFTMMLYFLISYLLLPRLPSGALPQISAGYAKYPYISSIGALHLAVFQASAILVALLMTAGYGIDYHVHANLKPGAMFRRPKLVAAILAAVFLVALTFANVNDGTSVPHLVFTSIQIIALGFAKLFGFLQNHCLLKAAPDLRPLRIGQRYRTVVVSLAIPAWSMAIIGMYGCAGSVATLPSTATCYKIVTVAAPAEWMLSITFILLLFTIGYDNYNAEEIRKVILFRCPPPVEGLESQSSEEDLVTPSSWTSDEENVEKEKKDHAILLSSQENLLPIEA